jgi:hypothetical protein
MALVLPGRGAPRGGSADSLEQTCRGAPETVPPLLVDQDLALTRVETLKVWGVPCPHASRRCPP